MKNIYSLLFVLLLASSIVFGQGQFRGNVSEGVGNTIVFSAKPKDNVNNIGFSTIEYFVRYPKTAPEFTYGVPVNNLTNFPGMGNWQVHKKAAEDALFFYDWFLYTAPSPITGLRSYTSNEVYEVITVQVNGAQVKDLGLTLVHEEDEDPVYYVFTNNIGTDSRPNDLSEYFYPSTTVTGTAPNRLFAQSILLPVNFKSFYAIKQGDNAKLTWDVSGDEKNSYFQVQRSTDGRNFTNIQKVEALKNGRSDNSYETMDLNLSKLGSKEIFYQIAQFDQDGTKTMSPVRKLSVDGLGKAVVAYPNPTAANAKLVVDAPESGKGQIILRDNLGRQVQNINAQFNKGINQFELQMSGLSNGDYKVSVQGAGLNETIKLQKIR
jgi:hypothetical protein